MYEFLTGPMAWAAFGVFVIGMAVRIISLVSLTRKKDKVVFNHFNMGWALRSIFHWLVPFGSQAMKEKPFFTIATFVFHITLVFTPILLLSHNIIWDERWGITWWSLPEDVADYMAVAMVIAGLYLLIRRLTAPEVKIVTTGYDYFLLAVATLPFITGFLAYHQLFDYNTMLILHILSGEAMLIAIPLTKLSHMVLFFFTRAHIGSEFGQRRGAVSW